MSVPSASSPAAAPETGPLVTFFVIAYRQERVVREAVASAFAQTYAPLEIILSDDCSPDGTFRVMEEMAAAYDGPHRVILNRNPRNLGIVPHLDRIMELSSGDLIVQNAGDDVSRPDRAARLAALRASRNPGPTLVHSAAAVIDARGRRIGVRLPRSEMIEAPTPLNIMRHRLIALGAASAWGREAFDAFGPLGGDLGVEDTVLPFRATLLGGIAYDPEELVSWRADGASWTPEGGTEERRRHGFDVRLARWRAQNARHVLTRFADRDYPDKAETEAICRDDAARLGLLVDLAEASGFGRLALAPRALAEAARRRSSGPLRQWLRHLLAGLGIRRRARATGEWAA